MTLMALLSIAAPPSAPEGNSGTTTFTFVVTRSGNTTTVCSATWTLTGGLDATDLATGQATTGTVSFAAADTTKNIAISVKGDTTIEGDEIMTLTLSAPVNCVLNGGGYGGTVAVNTDWTVTYTPATNFVGSDSFAYTIKDSSARTASATVAVTVTT